MNSGVYGLPLERQESNVDNRWNIARNYDSRNCVHPRTVGARYNGTELHTNQLGGAYPSSRSCKLGSGVARSQFSLTLALFSDSDITVRPSCPAKIAFKYPELDSQVNAVVWPLKHQIRYYQLVGLNMSYAGAALCYSGSIGLYGAYGLGVYLFFVAGGFPG